MVSCDSGIFPESSGNVYSDRNGGADFDEYACLQHPGPIIGVDFHPFLMLQSECRVS